MLLHKEFLEPIVVSPTIAGPTLDSQTVAIPTTTVVGPTVDVATILVANTTSVISLNLE